jgi:hypothetical protein
MCDTFLAVALITQDSLQVIFGAHGALAGLRGTTDVGVHILGLPFDDHEETTAGIDLLGLPFQGSVHVGNKVLLV